MESLKAKRMKVTQSMTIRMLRRKRIDYESHTLRDLDGYVFADMTHARQWLSQPFVHDFGISALEIVEVSDLRGCPKCGGTGYTQTVKSIRKLTLDEFLKEQAP